MHGAGHPANLPMDRKGCDVFGGRSSQPVLDLSVNPVSTLALGKDRRWRLVCLKHCYGQKGSRLKASHLLLE